MSVASASAEAMLPARDVYSVSRLNREARNLLEGGFPLIWLEGELSNLACPSSGHLYFTLKDHQAQVRAAMFRNRNQSLRFTPKEGMLVLVRARVSLYESRGEFQLIVEHMEEAGDGALRRAFEALKQRLAAEGLFDEARKRTPPVLPRRIGVITSPTGAAIRDILSVLRRRFPAIPVLIYPVAVQGRDAPGQIAAALRLASERRECDVLILARGGGSLEDLWAFNDEAVARAVHGCAVPVVSGIGHEIDFTIADFVADRRAATPSAAAELVSPDQNEWLLALARIHGRLHLHLRHHLDRLRQRLAGLTKRLEQQHPGQKLRQQSQRLDDLEQHLVGAWRSRHHQLQIALAQVGTRLQRHLPLHRIQQLALRREALAQRLNAALGQDIERRRKALASAVRALNAVSPLATLARGYAIVTRLPERIIVRDARQARAGDQIEARLARGRLVCTVNQTEEETDD
jgi:exodeoxyribonuclease VII large subunit